MNVRLGRPCLRILYVHRSSTLCNNINICDRSWLDGNHLDILSRNTVSGLNLSYQLRALLNHMIRCATIPTCRSEVSTVTGEMPSLVIVVADDLASTSSYHTTTTTSSKSTSTGCTTTVTITIIDLCFILYPIGVIGATLNFIMSYRLTESTIGVLRSLSIPL